jgi:hypothetical protein
MGDRIAARLWWHRATAAGGRLSLVSPSVHAVARVHARQCRRVGTWEAHARRGDIGRTTM